MLKPASRLTRHQYKQLADALARLPKEMQNKVLARAFGRSKDVVERNYSQLASRRMKIEQKHIKKRLTTTVGKGDIVMRIKSSQIPLAELNPRQGRRGVIIRGRKSIRGSFPRQGHQRPTDRHEARWEG